MPEYHPDTDVEIPDNVPTSDFRNAIPNTKRYMRKNEVTLDQLCEASHKGDYDALEEMLETGDERNLFNHDLNEHFNNTFTPLMLAALGGQTECVELLLKAKADPHVKERMGYGQDPEDGRTALDIAKELNFDDIPEMLEKAEKDTPYGFYVPEGPTNNTKIYGGFQWGTKPPKGWHSARPGVAERQGFDPMKYGTGPVVPKKEKVARSPPPARPKPAKPAEPTAPQLTAPTPAREPPLPVALLFPGQGSQYVKMLSAVKDIPAVETMLAQARDILGYDILDMCLNGPESKLEETTYCQPAMFIGGLAGVEKLRAEKPEAIARAQAMAGLSLGEYTALCAAGVFTFEDGLRLVQLRGQAMQEAASMSKQAMLSVAGLEKVQLANLCREAAKKEGPKGVCQIANELFPKGFSCAGTQVAVNHLKDAVEKAGALQAKLLKTSGGFHTNLMAPAQEKLGAALDEVLPKMKPPSTAVYMNVTAQPIAPGSDPSVVVDLLKRQLTSAVLWEPSVKKMIKDGVTEFYEVGPMKQIKAMMKRIDQKAWTNTTNVEV